MGERGEVQGGEEEKEEGYTDAQVKVLDNIALALDNSKLVDVILFNMLDSMAMELSESFAETLWGQ